MTWNNFHTHTNRCQHAVDREKAYYQQACTQEVGYLGFSDHAPWPFVNYESGMRMRMDEFDGYVQSVHSLSGPVQVRCGLEMEYFPEYLDWIQAAHERLDYLILGQHFDQNEKTGVYFGRCFGKEDFDHYVDQVLEGLSTGYYAILAHPDLICQNPWVVFTDYQKDRFREMIRLAKKRHIPLEYNLLGLHEKRAYPHPAFWQLVKEEKAPVIIGVDAHHPQQIQQEAFLDAYHSLKQAYLLVDTY